MLDNNSTIAAIATANGVGAIGVIRVSGKEAISIASKVFKGSNLNQAQSHTLHYGHIYDGDKIIDEVVISLFRAPRSFTTEDSVEISGHGSPFILEQILQRYKNNNIQCTPQIIVSPKSVRN